MITTEQVQQVRGGTALDANGNKIGSIGEVYLDDRTGQPAWITINTGLFGTTESFVPVQELTVEGENVRVPYDKDKVKDAPRVDADQHLDVEQEKELYRYYGVNFEAGAAGESPVATGGGNAGNAAAGGLGGAAGAAGVAGAAGAADSRADARRGDDTARTEATPVARERKEEPKRETAAAFAPPPERQAPTTPTAPAAEKRVAADGVKDERDLDGDGTVTRYEERLHVATQRQEAGRVRLRKSVITEDQTVTVPVSREEVSLERFAIDDPQVVEGDDVIGEDVREIILYQEVPVVSKQTVAVERVGLRKNVIKEERQVTDKIRREQVDLDGDGIPDNLQARGTDPNRK